MRLVNYNTHCTLILSYVYTSFSSVTERPIFPCQEETFVIWNRMVTTVMLQLLPRLQTLLKCSVFQMNVVKPVNPWNIVLIRGKHTLDLSKVPTLLDEDLEEEFVRGSGPGGSNVNKTSNAVVLKHKPTGIIIKCHQSRSLHKNRELAKEMLIVRLDNLVNGDLSVEAQKQKLLDKKSKERSGRAEKLKNLKEEWKQRENID